MPTETALPRALILPPTRRLRSSVRAALTWLAAALAMALAAGLPLAFAGCGPARPTQTVFVAGMSADDVERLHPLTAAARQELTPENVETLAQWQLDQLYARLTAGPIPDGAWQGRFFFAEGGGPRKLSAALGGLGERLADVKLRQVDRLGEALWKGKVFFRSEGVLRNMIDHDRTLARLFDVPHERLRTETIGGRRVALLFPAHLSCAESLYDRRRPSVIIDYADTDQIEGYLPEIDALAGRDGLAIRDEIRRVRPGFYLGRAYAGDRMLLSFTLWNEAEAKAAENGAAVGAEDECAAAGATEV